MQYIPMPENHSTPTIENTIINSISGSKTMAASGAYIGYSKR
jgi:hypothetical protein